MALRREVKRFSKRKPEKLQAALEGLRTRVQENKRIAKYIGNSFAAQVEKVYVELGGKPFPSKSAGRPPRDQHAHAHGVNSP